jgi:3-ketosteroid 9alpha-monooxygenase subunit B
MTGEDAVEDDAPVATVGPVREAPASVVGDLDGEEFALDGWAPDQVLLDFLLSKGVGAPYSCREGNCSACACIVLEGEVQMKHNEVLDDDDLADGIRLACQSLPVSDTVKVTYSG